MLEVVLYVLEVMKSVLCAALYPRLEGGLFAGGAVGDVLCAALYDGGCGRWVQFRISKFPLW